MMPATSVGSNGTAAVALGIAIASWFLCWGLGGGLALWLALSAQGEIQRTGQTGGGMATAAIWIGGVQVALVAGAILLFGLLALIGALGAGAHQ